MSRIVVKFEIEETSPGGGNQLPSRATLAKFEVETSRGDAFAVYKQAVKDLTWVDSPENPFRAHG